MRPSDHKPAHACRAKKNVGDLERIMSIGAGVGIMLFGLKRDLLRTLILESMGAALVYRGVGGHCHVYDALGVDGTAPAPSGVPAQAGVRVNHEVRIDRSPSEMYAFWRNFENLPRFMDHLRSVDESDDGTSHWVANAMLGATVEWRARVINDRKNELIAWESLPGSGLETAGSVHFEPMNGGRATLVKVTLKYNPPFGKAGIALATFLGQGADSKIRSNLDDLRDEVERYFPRKSTSTR